MLARCPGLKPGVVVTPPGYLSHPQLAQRRHFRHPSSPRGDHPGIVVGPARNILKREALKEAVDERG